MTNIIEQLDSEQIKSDIPDFAPGDHDSRAGQSKGGFPGAASGF